MSPDKPPRSDLEADAETRQVGPPEPERDGAGGPVADVSSATRGADAPGATRGADAPGATRGADAPGAAGTEDPGPGTDAEAQTDPATRGKDRDGGKPQGPLAVVRETAVLVVLAILLAVLFKTFLVQAFYIPSGSMEPTLNVSDRVLVEKVSYRFGDVKDGDVIVFVHDLPGVEPDSSNPVVRFFSSLGQAIGVAPPSDRDFIKRVVGTPGDRINCEQGKLLRNGKQVSEPYLAPGTTTENCTPTTVPAGKLFVMGDNRNNSEDSRTFGPVDRSTLVGRAFVRIWPLSHTGFLRRDQ